MILQLVDHLFPPALSKVVPQFEPDHRMCDRSHRDKHDADTEQNQKGIDHTPGMAERMGFLIAHHRMVIRVM
jgi:hypothetical protein